MKQILFLFIIILISSYSFSQKKPAPNVIKKESELYEAIKADREIVRQYIISGNAALKNYIDKFHTYRYRSNKTYILNFNERLIAQFASGSFKSIIEDINNNQHLKRRLTDNLQHYEPIVKNDEATIKSVSQRILDNISKSNLSDYEKELLTLYYKSTINKLYNNFFTTYFDQKEVNNQSEALIPLAKNPRQRAFIQRKVITEPKSDVLLAYSFDALNSNIYTGNYSKYLFNNIHIIGFSINVIKKHIYFNGGISLYNSELKNDIPNNELWVKGEEIEVSQYDLGLGYPFILSKRLIIAPVANISHFSYYLNKTDSKTHSQTTLNFGANVHFKFSSKMQRVSDKIHAFRLKYYIPNSLKLFAGYQPMPQKDGLGLSGGAFVFSLGVGRF